jgi:hypothetical protein
MGVALFCPSASIQQTHLPFGFFPALATKIDHSGRIRTCRGHNQIAGYLFLCSYGSTSWEPSWLCHQICPPVGEEEEEGVSIEQQCVC